MYCRVSLPKGDQSFSQSFNICERFLLGISSLVMSDLVERLICSCLRKKGIGPLNWRKGGDEQNWESRLTEPGGRHGVGEGIP